MGRQRKESGSFCNLSHREVCDAFHVGDRAVYKWVEAGCPRNADGTYDLYVVHCWLVENNGSGKKSHEDLEKQKLEESIRKLQLENEKKDNELRGNYIKRTDHDSILLSRASSLRNFLERSMAISRPLRSNRSVEELVSIDYDLVTQMMSAWSGTK